MNKNNRIASSGCSLKEQCDVCTFVFWRHVLGEGISLRQAEITGSKHRIAEQARAKMPWFRHGTKYAANRHGQFTRFLVFTCRPIGGFKLNPTSNFRNFRGRILGSKSYSKKKIFRGRILKIFFFFYFFFFIIQSDFFSWLDFTNPTLLKFKFWPLGRICKIQPQNFRKIRPC